MFLFVNFVTRKRDSNLCFNLNWIGNNLDAINYLSRIQSAIGCVSEREREGLEGGYNQVWLSLV